MKKYIIMTIILFIICLENVEALKNEKYFKTVVENGVVNNYEISKAEYEAIDNETILPCSLNVTTEYKKMTISSEYNEVELVVDWKKTPKYLSYDVIALRGENLEFNFSSFEGKQIYVFDGSKVINYNYPNNNMKLFNNGLGVSMNLVDNSINHSLKIRASFTKNNNNAKIFGSYQHAQRNVTLAQSKNYIIDANGYGKVIKFDNSVSSYYDGVSGVEISI